ncbi:MAG: ABC transporter ATP-binding protein [Fimbriiglobus sp.]
MHDTNRSWNPLTRLTDSFRNTPADQTAVPTIRRSRVTLSATGLTRSFGSGDQKTYALRDTSLELKAGDMNLLMGPSGSGKSTLLAVISALLHPDEGVVMAAGENIWQLSESGLEQFRLKHCSYIFQGYNLFPALTARQQLEVVLRWGEGCGASEAKQRSEHVLGQLGLSNKTHLRPAQLSGGEKQRVAIARALVKNPTFIFADEPTSALDWDNGQQVIRLLQNCAHERGATVLVVTHDHRLEPFADNKILMADGQLQDSSHHDSAIIDFDPKPGEVVPKSDPRLCLREPTPSY